MATETLPLDENVGHFIASRRTAGMDAAAGASGASMGTGDLDKLYKQLAALEDKMASAERSADLSSVSARADAYQKGLANAIKLAGTNTRALNATQRTKLHESMGLLKQAAKDSGGEGDIEAAKVWGDLLGATEEGFDASQEEYPSFDGESGSVERIYLHMAKPSTKDSTKLALFYRMFEEEGVPNTQQDQIAFLSGEKGVWGNGVNAYKPQLVDQYMTAQAGEVPPDDYRAANNYYMGTLGVRNIGGSGAYSAEKVDQMARKFMGGGHEKNLEDQKRIKKEIALRGGEHSRAAIEARLQRDPTYNYNKILESERFKDFMEKTGITDEHIAFKAYVKEYRQDRRSGRKASRKSRRKYFQAKAVQKRLGKKEEPEQDDDVEEVVKEKEVVEEGATVIDPTGSDPYGYSLDSNGDITITAGPQGVGTVIKKGTPQWHEMMVVLSSRGLVDYEAPAGTETGQSTKGRITTAQRRAGQVKRGLQQDVLRDEAMAEVDRKSEDAAITRGQKTRGDQQAALRAGVGTGEAAQAAETPAPQGDAPPKAPAGTFANSPIASWRLPKSPAGTFANSPIASWLGPEPTPLKTDWRALNLMQKIARAKRGDATSVQVRQLRDAGELKHTNVGLDEVPIGGL